MDTSRTLVHGRSQQPRSDHIRICDERAQHRGELALGRYRLLERLGAGGFGTVWRACDEQLGRAVALKRIALPSTADRHRAIREAHATARLSHPAIVALYEACADDDAFYLISELVEGETLARLIEADALCDEEIAEIGLDLCDALAHAHARGVIHRDVKPQNVLVPGTAIARDRSTAAAWRASSPAAVETAVTPAAVSAVATAKLADFGGALLADSDALTRTGDVFGTLAYMAPEQSDGREAGPAADLYALALVLYEAFSGENPVRGRTPAATAKRIGAPIPPLQRRRRDLPRVLTRALDAALVADPHRRGELVDLRRALDGVPESGYRRSRLRSRGHVRRAAGARTGDAIGARTGDAGYVSHERDHARARVESCAENTQTPGVAPIAGVTAAARTGSRGLALPKAIWIGCALAVTAWQGAAGRVGLSLLLLAATAPLLLLPRRAGPGWLAAAAAPALGLGGLAGAFPALAGQRADWRARAGIAALGFWWLALAEPLLARRLWLGPPRGLPARAAWEASPAGAATHVLAGVLTPQLAIGVCVWAVGAAVLPWLVRGRSAVLDALTAIGWTVALAVAAPLIERGTLAHPLGGSPRGVLLGALLGCTLAICARALRGPVSAASA